MPVECVERAGHSGRSNKIRSGLLIRLFGISMFYTRHDSHHGSFFLRNGHANLPPTDYPLLSPIPSHACDFLVIEKIEGRKSDAGA